MNCFCVFQTTFCKMKNRKQCIQDSEDQTHEGMEGKVCVCENTKAYYSGSSCESLIFFHLLSQLVCCLFWKKLCKHNHYLVIFDFDQWGPQIISCLFSCFYLLTSSSKTKMLIAIAIQRKLLIQSKISGRRVHTFLYSENTF